MFKIKSEIKLKQSMKYFKRLTAICSMCHFLSPPRKPFHSLHRAIKFAETTWQNSFKVILHMHNFVKFEFGWK